MIQMLSSDDRQTLLKPPLARPRREAFVPMCARVAAKTVLLALLFGILLYSFDAVAQTPKRILIMSGSDPNHPGFSVITQAIATTVRNGSPTRVELLYELQEHFVTPQSRSDDQAMAKYLREKYSEMKIDLVLGLVAPRFGTLRQIDPSLFADVPKVFFDFEDVRDATLAQVGPHTTGVWVKKDVVGTLQIALTLQPNPDKVVVIAGNAPVDQQMLDFARPELRTYENKIPFTYLTNLTLKELNDQLSRLSRNTIVLYLMFSSDREGNKFAGPEALAMVAPRSGAPLYGFSDRHLGSGIVGGSVVDFPETGKRLGEVSQRILSGESVDSIPSQTVPSVKMFDWRELRRWGFNESQLPPGSVVLFRQPTLWEQYKWGLLALIAAIVLEAALIARLLFMQEKRRQAEIETRRTHRRLQEIVSNVPGMVWETVTDKKTRDRKTTFVSDYVREMLGYTPDEWLAQPPGFGLRIMVDEDRDGVLADSETAIATGKDKISEHRWRAKDGRLVWIESHLSPIVNGTGEAVGLRGVSLDITERKLAEEKERAILEAIPDLMFLQTADGVYLDYHANNKEALYVPAEQYLGKNMSEILPPHLAEEFAHYFKRALDTGETQIVEYTLAMPDGERWFEARLVRSEGNILSVVRDITERKRSLDQLRESEERFGKAFRSNPQPMSITTVTDGVYIDVNDSFLGMSGYSREEVIGHSSLELGVWTESEKRAVFMKQLIEKGSLSNLETIFRTKNGTQRILLSSAECVEIGGQDCVLIASSDITERILAQQALVESEQRFRLMADTAPVMIWISSDDKLCTYFNQQWLDFTGRTMEQEMGNGWTEGVHPNDYEGCLNTYNTAFDRREQFRMEYRLRRFDGQYRWIIDHGTPRMSSTGKFSGYIGSCLDITDRKQSEEALTNAHEELVVAHEEVQRLKNQLEEENIYLQEEIRLAKNFGEMVGESDAIKYVMFKVNHVAVTDSTVLITGETGTGKELVARAIHSASARSDRSLITVNCAALPATLIESELFGHEKGAFTGASARKPGRFELADGGTIFLDEVGELPLESQVKLLRVIQEGEVQRLGGTNPIKVDVRIIAATNRNLKREIERGAFREDLWYRLNVFPITVPPLRQRGEDIPLLVEHFIANYASKFGKTITSISPQAMQKLQEHSWPGNVRELANVIERAVIYTQGTALNVVDVFEQSKETAADALALKSLEEVEREYILHVLEHTSWRIEGARGAAKLLGMNPSTLRTRMIKLGIHKNNSQVNSH